MSAPRIITLGILALTALMGVVIGLILYASREEKQLMDGGATLASERGGSSDNIRLFGFVIAAEEASGTVHIAVDRASFFTGAQAQEAALRARACTRDDVGSCTPNDFFIENTDEKLTWYPLARDVRVVMQTLTHDAQGLYVRSQISTLQFMELITSPQNAPHWRKVPFWITVEEGAAVEIEEQYLP